MTALDAGECMKAFTTESVETDNRMAFIVCRGQYRRGVVAVDGKIDLFAEGSAVAVDGKIDTTPRLCWTSSCERREV